MQITVNLEEMFSYNPIGFILCILIIIAAILIFVCTRPKKPRKVSKVPQPRRVFVRNVPLSKQKYHRILTTIARKHSKQQITDREAYQELSIAIRHFVHDVSGIKVQNYTLEEIKKTNMPDLYYLIAECYMPEFSAEEKSNVYETIDKARRVIERWN